MRERQRERKLREGEKRTKKSKKKAKKRFLSRGFGARFRDFKIVTRKWGGREVSMMKWWMRRTRREGKGREERWGRFFVVPKVEKKVNLSSARFFEKSWCCRCFNCPPKRLKKELSQGVGAKWKKEKRGENGCGKGIEGKKEREGGSGSRASFF